MPGGCGTPAPCRPGRTAPGQTSGELGTYRAYVKIDAADKGTPWARAVRASGLAHAQRNVHRARGGDPRDLCIGGYRPGFPVWADDFRLTEEP